jgi:hypothetical protein
MDTTIFWLYKNKGFDVGQGCKIGTSLGWMF